MGCGFGSKISYFHSCFFKMQLASKIGNLFTNYDGSSDLQGSWRICVMKKIWSCCELMTTRHLDWIVSRTKDQ